MESEENTIRCLALPIVGEQALVPNAVVAEVFAAHEITRCDDGPGWLLGSLSWRGRALPLVCMEAALGGARLDVGGRSKIVVLKALSTNDSLENYAVVVQGIPHQVLASEQTVELDSSVNGARPFVAADLQLEGERAFIPDLDAVEQALIDSIEEWQRAPRDDDEARG